MSTSDFFSFVLVQKETNLNLKGRKLRNLRWKKSYLKGSKEVRGQWGLCQTQTSTFYHKYGHNSVFIWFCLFSSFHIALYPVGCNASICRTLHYSFPPIIIQLACVARCVKKMPEASRIDIADLGLLSVNAHQSTAIANQISSLRQQDQLAAFR